MELTSRTIDILRNFANINPNIVVAKGNILKTMSIKKNLVVTAVIEESFPTDFGIYDLSEFLSVLNLVDNPRIEFDEKNCSIRDGSGLSSVKYFYCDPEMLTAPKKDIQMPDPELGVSIDEDKLNQIRKAAAVLGHTELAITGDNGIVTASVLDTRDSTSNVFEIELDKDNSCKNEFNFVVSIPNLKLLPGDYFVSISSKLISNWTNSNYPVDYFIALEKNSSYNV